MTHRQVIIENENEIGNRNENENEMQFFVLFILRQQNKAFNS